MRYSAKESWLGQQMQFDCLKRREFMSLLGGVAVGWPLAARAQPAAMPVIGFLSPTSPDPNADYLRAFRQALKETGHIEGQNVAIEYCWAENQMDRLPALAADLVRRQVAVIVAAAQPSAFVARAATSTIPRTHRRRPSEHSASKSLTTCSRLPTRLSNEAARVH